MSVLAKTDSEVSSLSHSSPGRSPRRSSERGAVYYVQSPSRDSHDGEKTTNSFHSSPMGSPPHSHSNSSLGPHSRESASTRFSGSRSSKQHNSGPQSKGWRPWKDQFDSIEEEGLLDDDNENDGLSRRCYFLAFIFGFFALFTVFSLILWGASRAQKPVITMKSIRFDQFLVQAGEDFSGVATNMVSMNSTVKFTFRNTATFFGVHVKSTSLDLSFFELTVASGMTNFFYQSRKSQRPITVNLIGNKIPLYGGGATLGSLNGAPIQPLTLALKFEVRSRANVLGRLVRPKFNRRVECTVVMDPKKMNMAVALKNKCTY
ncbi:uncharacterized protein LOC126801059 [Argentina anserina]|uniref:uncharacterized protein LOC126801059 n=1 Tax=Argentina anserina TaxID=57926 RepID=UPI002176785B|nr:uncharacterized protein LOC126801059 [Potentilla anserina]